MQKGIIQSHNTRKKIWMLSSGALFSMKNNKKLYEGLINYKNYPNYYQRSIYLDINRTIKKSQSTQQDLKSLQNLLIAFSRRNPYIGYCQGLNFIAHFILTMGFSQQQSFWLLSTLTQTIIPMDYYTNMMGVATDQQIFTQILTLKNPLLIKKFQQLGLDGSVLTIQWFVCLFTSTLPFYALQNRKWKQTQGDDWDLYWCQKQYIPQTLDKMRLFPQKKINHFRNWYQICRKDLLSKNIKKCKRALQKQGKSQQANSYNYLPLTYNLPSQYPIFAQQFKKCQKQKAIWIMKPIGKSQGKGIFLFTNISKISQWSDNINAPQAYIVQRYIHDPLLVGNKKFDLRIYVLVTSHNPLTVYLYRQGFARFTHYRYQMTDINNLQGHVTNVYYQKNSQNYDQQKGGKYMLDKLRLYMVSKYGIQNVQKCFFQIQQMVIKTLLATCKIMMNDRKCFQLYGFDVLIDSKLRPWLVQVNASPSMTGSTNRDKKLKTNLLDDLLTVLNIQQILTGQQQNVGGFDIIYRNNRRIKAMSRNNSLLGCLNDRQSKLRKMAKAAALRLAQKQKQKLKDSSLSVSTNGNILPAKPKYLSRQINVNKTRQIGAIGSSNSINNNYNNQAKLPKMPMPGLSNKNIEATKKVEGNNFRITTGSRQRGRVGNTNVQLLKKITN